MNEFSGGWALPVLGFSVVSLVRSRLFLLSSVFAPCVADGLTLNPRIASHNGPNRALG